MPRERSRQLIGNVWKYVTAQQSGNGNGGSQPGMWQMEAFLFSEQTVTGDIVGTLVLPAGACALGFLFEGITDWFDTAAAIQIEDESDVYWQGEQAFATDADGGWFKPGGGLTATKYPNGIYYPSGQTITMTYTTTSADPAPTGQSRVSIIYALDTPSTDVPA